MAFTTVTNNAWDGTQGQLRFRALFDGAAQDQTDLVLVDISTLGGVGVNTAPNSVKIQRLQAVVNGAFQATLEYDATTDQVIDAFSGQTSISNPYIVDYTGGPNRGVAPNAAAGGFVGDILLTTVGAAASDELNLVIDYRRKT